MLFAIYAIDKSAAKRKRNRVPEATLHVISLLGGWPGAIIGQVTFRHKTVKASYNWTFYTLTIINILANLAVIQLQR